MRAQIRMGRLQRPLFMFHLNGNTMGGKLFVNIPNIVMKKIRPENPQLFPQHTWANGRVAQETVS